MTSDASRLQATFVIKGRVITGTELPEYIQLLHDENDHAKRGFFYEWISAAEFMVSAARVAPHASRLQRNSDLDGHRKPVEIKPRVPAFWPEKNVIGVYDRKERRAMFAVDGKYVEVRSGRDACDASRVAVAVCRRRSERGAHRDAHDEHERRAAQLRVWLVYGDADVTRETHATRAAPRASRLSQKRKLSSFNEWEDIRDECISPKRIEGMLK